MDMSRLFYMKDPTIMEYKREVIGAYYEGSGIYQNVLGKASLEITGEAIEIPEGILADELKSCIDKIKELEQEKEQLHKEMREYSNWVQKKFAKKISKELTVEKYKEQIRQEVEARMKGREKW